MKRRKLHDEETEISIIIKKSDSPPPLSYVALNYSMDGEFVPAKLFNNILGGIIQGVDEFNKAVGQK
jgi:hypothetical protein